MAKSEPQLQEKWTKGKAIDALLRFGAKLGIGWPEFGVLVAIVQRDWTGLGKAQISIKGLSRDMGISVQAIRRIKDKLLEKGLICVIEVKPGHKGLYDLQNLYEALALLDEPGSDLGFCDMWEKHKGVKNLTPLNDGHDTEGGKKSYPLNGQRMLPPEGKKSYPPGVKNVTPTTVLQNKQKQQQHRPAQQNGQYTNGVASLGEGVVDVSKKIEKRKNQNDKPNEPDPKQELIQAGVTINMANQFAAEYESARISEVIAWAKNPANEREDIAASIVSALSEGWTVTNKKQPDKVQSNYSPKHQAAAKASREAYRRALEHPKPPDEIVV